VHPLFPEAFSFLCRSDLHTLAEGRYELSGNRLSASIARGQGKPLNSAVLEVHARYIDIQCVLDGVESVGWRPASTCLDTEAPYDETRDIRFLSDKPLSWIRNTPGLFVVFFPGDAHAPMVSDASLLKVVVKVAVQ
jgi:YhcH/YjgK/YiaL family protein